MYITTSSPIQAGQPYTAEETERIVDQFNRDGYCHLGAVLSDDEVGALLEAMQRKVKDPRMAEDQPGDHRRGVQNLMRMFEYDITFRDLIVREPFASLAEAILGETCQCMAQNALYKSPNPEGEADPLSDVAVVLQQLVLSAGIVVRRCGRDGGEPHLLGTQGQVQIAFHGQGVALAGLVVELHVTRIAVLQEGVRFGLEGVSAAYVPCAFLEQRPLLPVQELRSERRLLGYGLLRSGLLRRSLLGRLLLGRLLLRGLLLSRLLLRRLLLPCLWPTPASLRH